MKKMLKKFLAICTIILAVSAVFTLVLPETTYADEASAFVGDCRTNFLGLTSWDCGVNIQDEASLKSGIWTIVANVLLDISIIAAYLVLVYVIYGGYLYTFSGGDVGKVATGRKTIVQAFTGLAIVIAANLIIGTIRIALIGNNATLADCIHSACVENPAILFTNLIQWVVGVAGIVSLIFIIYGGISYTISMGDPNKIQKAKNMILYSLIGLVICGLAEILVVFISNTIHDNVDGETDVAINLTINQKELS